MSTTLVLARLTFREAVRKKMVIGVALLSAVFLLVYAFGYIKADEDFFLRVSARPNRPPQLTYEVFANLLVLMGFYVVNFLAGVMAIFTAVGAISAEIEGQTFHAVVPKPLHRWQIVVGKWIGYASMLTVYVLAMTGGVLGTAWVVGRYMPPAPLAGIALIVLVTLLLLSLTILGSCLLSTTTNGIVVFMLYGIALTGGLVEQLGALIDNQVMKLIGIVASLVIPSDVIWKLAANMLQSSAGLSFGPMALMAASPPSPAMVVYALVYAGLAVVAAVVAFNGRDL